MIEVPTRGRFAGARQTVHWGIGCLDDLPRALSDRSLHRVTVVTGDSLSRSALIGCVRRLIAEVGDGDTWPHARQHCPRSSVSAGVEMVRDADPAALVAVGGGSAIDTACAIAAEAASTSGRIPVIAVPTTFSQAEFTDFVGISEPTGEKLVLRSPDLMPSTVFLDPEQLRETPAELMITSGVKAIESTIASIVQGTGGLVGEPVSQDALVRMITLLPRLQDGGQEDLLAFQLAAWTGVYGRFHGPTAEAVGAPRLWLGSAARHQLGAVTGAPHAAISAALLPHLLGFHEQEAYEPLLGIARRLGLGSVSDLRRTLTELWSRLGLPGSLGEIGISPADVTAAHSGMLNEQAELRARSDEILEFLHGVV